ncbi:MAG: sulfate ABC transporter substrate-binding protein [Thermoguttaceae bacterium]|nr:sulfate ABC transporter substrate-binding protein [Thermoguttaceae bacterium]
MNKPLLVFATLALAVCAGFVGCSDGESHRKILNVSYDPTRELYEEFDEAFAEHWLATTGETIEVEKSAGGSGSQARAVKMGQEADVVTLALAFDVDDVGTAGLFAEGANDPESPNYWQKRLPNNSCPYTSTIVLVVRKGNPKKIRDWADLTRADVEIVTPNPKTSGGARWNYLALWGYALDKALAPDGGLDALKAPEKAERVEAAQAEARSFVKKVFANVRGMQAGARASTDDFVKNQVGDVFIAWENEAILAKIFSNDELEIVVPSISVKAEPPVAVVDKIVDRRGTRDLAEAYLNFLYEPEAQDMIARNHYRPCSPEIAEKYKDKFPEIRLFTVDDVFGGWVAAQREHFNADGVFDKILEENYRENK